MNSTIKLKFSKDEFLTLVNLMRVINDDYEQLYQSKSINIMLNTMFVKILYKFEKKLIPLQPKYSIKLETEYAICLYLHLSSLDIDNLGVYEKTVIASKKNQIHQELLT